MKLTPPPVRQDTEENVLPLINIVFLLLIFFMLAGTIEAPDLFPIELPKSVQSADVDKSPPQLLINADGEIAFQQDRLDSDRLADRLKLEFNGQASPMLIIKADMATPAKVLLDVVSQVGDIPGLRLTLLADKQ